MLFVGLVRKVRPIPPQPNVPWSVLVREKNDIDLAIGKLATKIDKYLNTHPDFRSVEDLKREARILMDRAKTAEAHVEKTRIL